MYLQCINIGTCAVCAACVYVSLLCSLLRLRREMVMGGSCPKQADRPEYDIYAACNFAWFLKRSNVELNVQHIESAIQQVDMTFDALAHYLCAHIHTLVVTFLVPCRHNMKT